MRVVYPATELGLYLASLFKSLYEHDRLLRRMLIGLAGKNIRRAMEIFLEFCKSGHIGTQEYLKIKTFRGNYALPYSVVVRVLLRSSRRFYEGDSSNVKNVFQCNPDDVCPDHFVRFAILTWLRDHLHEIGPIGVQGFHRATQIIQELLPFGYDAMRVREELQYLARATCILTEHQRTDHVNDGDLVSISPAGYAHLSLVSNYDYLAAIAEDTWVDDQQLARLVAHRIGRFGRKGHFQRETTRANAMDFVEYLRRRCNEHFPQGDGAVNCGENFVQVAISELYDQVGGAVARERSRDPWITVQERFSQGQAYDGTVVRIEEYGVFVCLGRGITGLLHVSELTQDVSIAAVQMGDKLRVEIVAIDQDRRRMSLRLAGGTDS